MSGGSFLDSNVLVYTEAGVVSLQVLQEYFSAVTRRLGVDAAIARATVELLGAFRAERSESSRGRSVGRGVQGT